MRTEGMLGSENWKTAVKLAVGILGNNSWGEERKKEQLSEAVEKSCLELNENSPFVTRRFQLW